MDRLAYYRRWKLGEDPHALAREAGVTSERMRHMLAMMDAEVPLVDRLAAAEARIEADAETIAELALDAYCALTQADEAYQAQLRAEARIAELEAVIKSLSRLDTQADLDAAKREARLDGMKVAMQIMVDHYETPAVALSKIANAIIDAERGE